MAVLSLVRALCHRGRGEREDQWRDSVAEGEGGGRKGKGETEGLLSGRT